MHRLSGDYNCYGDMYCGGVFSLGVGVEEDKEMKDKLLSGRFIFTVVSAFVFAYLSVTRVLPVDKITEILLIVIYAYFNRIDRKQEGK